MNPPTQPTVEEVVACLNQIAPGQVVVAREWLTIQDAITLLSALEKDALPWVLASERLPERDGFYLVASSEPYPPDVYVLELRNAEYPAHAHWRATGEFRGSVTHWRPRPAPPAIDLARGAS